jgi:glutamate-1-semialdehyde 2,1-aminomutase
MAMIAPEGPVYQAGTLSGNPLAMTAGDQTLRVLARPGVFEQISKQTAQLVDGLVRIAQEQGVPFSAQSLGAMAGLYFSETPPTDLESAKACDLDRSRRYHAAMLARGVHLPPSPFEAFFVSLAHDDEVIGHVLAAHADALAAT